MHSRRTRPLRRIVRFNVFALRQGPLMGSQTPLGELVDALVRRGPAGLDHVQDAALVGGQAHDFAGQCAAQRHAGAQFL
jgi:hypothetical protein